MCSYGCSPESVLMRSFSRQSQRDLKPQKVGLGKGHSASLEGGILCSLWNAYCSQLILEVVRLRYKNVAFLMLKFYFILTNKNKTP